MSEALLTFVSVVATLATVGMFTSPLTTMNNLRLAKSVGILTVTAFSAQFINCTMWVSYGIQQEAMPLIVSNALGLGVAVYCMATFLLIVRKEEASGRPPRMTTYRKSLMNVVISVCVSVVLLVVFATLRSTSGPAVTAKVNGALGGTFLVILLSSPLTMASDIVRSQNAECLQPLTVGFSMLNCVLWTLYGVLISDPFVFVPNALGGVACILQISLLLRYGRHPVQVVDVQESVPIMVNS